MSLNIIRLAMFEIQKRSLNTYAGWLWSIIAPLTQMGIIYFIMTYIFKSTMENKVLWLVGGLGLWIVIQSALIRTCNSLVSRRALIQHNNVHFEGLVLADILGEVFILAPFFLVGIGYVFFVGTQSLSLLAVPYVFAVTVTFLFGVGLALAVLTPILRDLPYLLGLALQIAFWLTPIAYHQSILSDNIRRVTEYNPLTYYVSLAQKAFLGQPISFYDLAMPLAIAVVVAGVGLFLCKRLARRVVVYL